MHEILKIKFKSISLIVLGIAIKLAGILVTPKGIPIRVAETIPRSISHFTLLAASIAVTKVPKTCCHSCWIAQISY